MLLFLGFVMLLLLQSDPAAAQALPDVEDVAAPDVAPVEQALQPANDTPEPTVAAQPAAPAAPASSPHRRSPSPRSR